MRNHFIDEENECSYVNVNRLKPHPKLEVLCKISNDFLDYLEDDMLKEGFDGDAPIQVIRDEDGQLQIWDGLTRWKAAKKAGIKEVPIRISSFEKENEIILNVVTVQTARNRHFAALLKTINELAKEKLSTDQIITSILESIPVT